MRLILSLGVCFLIASLIFLSPSCKKTVTRTITDTVKHAWQEVPLFNSNGGPALSAYNQGDTQLVIGSNWFYSLLPVNRPTFNYLFTVPLPGASLVTPTYEAPFLTGAAVSYTTGTSLFVYGIPQNSNAVLAYTPVFTPGSFSQFAQQTTYPSLSSPAADYPMIRYKYLITPVETVGNGNQQVRFDLLRFDSAAVLGPFAFHDTPTVQRIVVTADASTIGFTLSSYYCATWFDKFFIYYGGQFFRIDTAGNVKSFGYAPVPGRFFELYNMFTTGNMLCINSGGVIYASTDQGETWSILNDLSQTIAGNVVYRNVGNDLYAAIDDLDMQIWKVVVNGKKFSFSEINNDGLENNLVTSLTRCGRYVFATTPTGVFYRDTALFNQLKNPIR